MRLWVTIHRVLFGFGLICTPFLGAPGEVRAQNLNVLMPAIGVLQGAVQQLDDEAGSSSVPNPLDFIQSVPRMESSRPAPTHRYYNPPIQSRLNATGRSPAPTHRYYNPPIQPRGVQRSAPTQPGIVSNRSALVPTVQQRRSAAAAGGLSTGPAMQRRVEQRATGQGSGLGGGSDTGVRATERRRSVAGVDRRNDGSSIQNRSTGQSDGIQSRGRNTSSVQSPNTQRSRMATRGSGEPGLIAERHECARNPGKCTPTRRDTAATAPKRDLASERQAASRDEADRRRRQELKRQQDNSSRAVAHSQGTCRNIFRGPNAKSGEYICGNVGEIHACRCTGSSCQLIPTKRFQCTKVGAIIR